MGSTRNHHRECRPPANSYPPAKCPHTFFSTPCRRLPSANHELDVTRSKALPIWEANKKLIGRSGPFHRRYCAALCTVQPHMMQVNLLVSFLVATATM